MSEPANLTDAGVRAMQGRARPATVTMDPAGIDLFALILYIVYAHKACPTQPQPNDSASIFESHRRQATDYLRASGDVVVGSQWKQQPYTGQDRTIFVYELAHKYRGADVITIAVDPCRPMNDCLFAVQGGDRFIQLDLSKIELRGLA